MKKGQPGVDELVKEAGPVFSTGQGWMVCGRIVLWVLPPSGGSSGRIIGASSIGPEGFADLTRQLVLPHEEDEGDVY